MKNGIMMLKDKTGDILKIEDIPDRTKAYTQFGGVRSELSRIVITEQVFDIAQHYFKSGVEFDEENADWVIFPNFMLPKRWHHITERSPLMVVFPTHYPETPPIGFYLKGDIPDSPNGHFYTQAYHDADKAPIEAGWKWYCVYINPGTWMPRKYKGPLSWRSGDNLWTYMNLVKEVLSSGD
ncbi:MAG TPA: hypothetical protein PKW56_10155 [Clostridiales bacterium]|nr:hypothetical protein [Clostridiales bacterium]